MNKIYLTILICFMIIVSACGVNDRDNAVTQENQAEVPSVDPSSAPEAVPDPEPAKPAKQAQRGLPSDEEVALMYITEYLNSDDIEGKKNFVKEHVAKEEQDTFMQYASYITQRDVRFKDPHVLDSVPLSIADQEVTLVLIEGYEDDDCNCGEKKEVIMLMKESKLVWGYLNSDEVHSRLTFHLLKGYFKNYAEDISELKFTQSAPTADEDIALAYFNNFHNSTDFEEKREFLNYVHPSTYNLISQLSLVITNKDVWLKNARVAESLEYQFDDQKGSLILVQGASARNKEHIMQVVNGQIGWKYTRANHLEKELIYDLLRSKFTASQL